MEQSPYYTLHLEIERFNSATGIFTRKEPEYHHYRSSDEAFLLLFGLPLKHLDRDIVVTEGLDYHIGRAFLTAPFSDEAVASLKTVVLPASGGGTVRYIMVEELGRKIDRANITNILLGMGFTNPFDFQLPLAHYGKDGSLVEDSKPGIYFQPGRYNSLYGGNFILETAFHAPPFEGDGPLTRAFTYSESIRELFYHITRLDTSGFQEGTAGRKEQALTRKVAIIGPHERDHLIQVYHASKGEHGIDRLGDAVFLDMEAHERSIPVRRIPELLTLPKGRDGLNRVLASTNPETGQLTETKAYSAIRVQFDSGKLALALSRPRHPRFVTRTDGRLPLKP